MNSKILLKNNDQQTMKPKAKSDLNIWEMFCKEGNDTRKLEVIPCEELNTLLCAFSKTSERKMATSSFQRSIQRYLTGQGSQAKSSKVMNSSFPERS